MCTVTFIPRETGYCVAMNRDEKLVRHQGLPPAVKVVKGHRVICPSEPGGGTWIAANDSGVSLALINWYSIARRIEISPVSRGGVINATCGVETPKELEVLLSSLPLQRINPFRLIVIFPGLPQITEHRWDLKTLHRNPCAWQPQQWISSGFDESKAQKERSRIFRQKLENKSAGTLGWMRRLHRSHAPERGAFSTCMHRADAATVSYTEAVVTTGATRMWHCLGAPCRPDRHFSVSLEPNRKVAMRNQ